MTSDQWVALIGQIGVGGVALLGIAWLFAKIVVPMVSRFGVDIVAAIKDAGAEVKLLRGEIHTIKEDMQAALHRIELSHSAALAGLTERITTTENLLKAHHEWEVRGRPANGSTDESDYRKSDRDLAAMAKAAVEEASRRRGK